jgi:hypothetical protein
LILLNFSHPLTEEQTKGIEAITGRAVAEVRNIPTQFDPERPYAPQVKALAEACRLTPEEWGTLSFLVVVPSLNIIAVALLAELHGRIGYFPSVVRLRPVPESKSIRYDVAEVINLQRVRDEARRRRC